MKKNFEIAHAYIVFRCSFQWLGHIYLPKFHIRFSTFFKTLSATAMKNNGLKWIYLFMWLSWPVGWYDWYAFCRCSQLQAITVWLQVDPLILSINKFLFVLLKALFSSMKLRQNSFPPSNNYSLTYLKMNIKFWVFNI